MSKRKQAVEEKAPDVESEGEGERETIPAELPKAPTWTEEQLREVANVVDETRDEHVTQFFKARGVAYDLASALEQRGYPTTVDEGRDIDGELYTVTIRKGRKPDGAA